MVLQTGESWVTNTPVFRVKQEADSQVLGKGERQKIKAGIPGFHPAFSGLLGPREESVSLAKTSF